MRHYFKLQPLCISIPIYNDRNLVGGVYTPCLVNPFRRKMIFVYMPTLITEAIASVCKFVYI